MNTGQLHIERRTFGETAILDCTGRIVVRREAEYFFDAAAFAVEKSRSLVVNLAGVSAIDSGGLGLLVLLHRLAGIYSCDLKVCAAHGSVAKTISLMKLDTVLDVHRSEDDAIGSIFRNLGRCFSRAIPTDHRRVLNSVKRVAAERR